MIETRNQNGVLEILIANPPVNALGARVRQGLMDAVAAAQTDGDVQAIVIRGKGRLFSAGADITEFTAPPAEPTLPQVIDAIEASVKPVVAAIHGTALGGGLEIALGSHFRIATRSAKLGLPEVKLGLLPGAGGTQRLPRLIGIEAALDIIVSGAPIDAASALALGLVDAVVEEDALEAEALALARRTEGPRRTGDLQLAPDDAAFERFVAANARKFAGLDAPAACIDAVRAATRLSLMDGQIAERALFLKLVTGAQSQALRHVFFAERAAAAIRDLPRDTPLRSVGRVGVIGAGTMGGGIAMNFLSKGVPVTIVEMNAEALERGVGLVRRNYEASAAKGRLTSEAVERAMALLTPTIAFEALADCDLIIEAVYESMEVKKQIFTRLDAIARPGAILASNTSFLSIDEIAAATARPQDVLGLHFFSPANVMKLVEVVRGAETADDVLATGMDMARRIGKVPVVSGVCFGFIGNRMLIPRGEQSVQLLLEGATPEQIDRVHTEFGLPMGSFQMSDLAGVDIGWHRDPSRIDSLQDALCAEGRWGQKTKAGYYDYDDRRRSSPSPVVAAIIESFRARSGVVAREISDDEILVRTLYTMVNEGAKIVEEGIAQRASDVDVVWIYGYGWPAHKGGPMFWADQIGAKTIVDAFHLYADQLGPDFHIAPLLLRSAREGLTFAELGR